MSLKQKLPIELKRDTQLTGATNRFDNEIAVYDDSLGPLWICGEEFGPSWIIRALSFEAAYGIWTDERPTIPQEEVHEAYGFDSDADMVKCDTECREGSREYPDLIEGYSYQDNASDTGIVATGHYEWLHELTPAFLHESEIRLKIEAY